MVHSNLNYIKNHGTNWPMRCDSNQDYMIIMKKTVSMRDDDEINLKVNKKRIEITDATTHMMVAERFN